MTTNIEKIQSGNGFSLIEVLFAVFVLSLGILGIAALQTISKQSNFEAIQRTTATMLANDIIERMRANPDSLASYVQSAQPVTTSTEPSPACNTDTVTCSGTQLAAHDLWEWQQAILGVTDTSGGNNTGGLVSPSACITANGTGYQVAIAWRGRTALSNPTSSACGGATGNYGTNNVNRRVLVINTFIN